MRRYGVVLLVTGVVATLAILAFAGYFTSDGWVWPPYGPANIQLFEYGVNYKLDEEQGTPDAYLWIWHGEDLIRYEMMPVTSLDGVAYYRYYTTLDEPGDDYSYQFTTIDDWTEKQDGPTVYASP